MAIRQADLTAVEMAAKNVTCHRVFSHGCITQMGEGGKKSTRMQKWHEAPYESFKSINMGEALFIIKLLYNMGQICSF